MMFDWSSLGRQTPTRLIKARNWAHHALQWAAKAASANSNPGADDNQFSLTWNGERRALLTQPLPESGATRIGLRLGALALLIERRNVVLDTYELQGRRDSSVGVWLDSALRALGLQPASGVTLPYSIPSHSAIRSSVYLVSGEADAGEELAHWFDGAQDLFTMVRDDLIRQYPRVSAVRCWPHHFDLTTRVNLDDREGEAAHTIGIGLSPGDEHYAQPYLYISPWPRIAPIALPDLPAPGRWHTQDFVAPVAVAEDILTLDNPAAQLLAFIHSAFEICRSRLAT